MRKVSRDGIDIPAELVSQGCIDHRTLIIANPADNEAKPDFYRGKLVNADGTVTFTVRDTLRVLYKSKCAYCERSAHAPKTDHHRPKGRVVGMPTNTYGYYWLAYEWTNLLPTCTNCNAVDAKGSRYPVLNQRNTEHPTLETHEDIDYHSFLYNNVFNLNEGALLLHPEYCDPELHFKFDRNGRIIGISPEGIESVRVLKLDHDDLNGWRKTIYMNAFNELLRTFDGYVESKDQIIRGFIINRIQKWLLSFAQMAGNDELEFTFFRKYLITEFEFFFIDPLDEVFRTILRNIFLEYLQTVGVD